MIDTSDCLKVVQEEKKHGISAPIKMGLMVHSQVHLADVFWSYIVEPHVPCVHVAPCCFAGSKRGVCGNCFSLMGHCSQGALFMRKALHFWQARVCALLHEMRTCFYLCHLKHSHRHISIYKTLLVPANPSELQISSTINNACIPLGKLLKRCQME